MAPIANKLNFSFADLQDQFQLDIRAGIDSKPLTTVLSEGLLVGPIEVSGTLSLVDDAVLFKGIATGKWRFECTRCLSAVEQDWSVALEQEAPFSDNHMDLSDEVRQSICLAQPMRILCRPDCRGLCQTCGKNNNTNTCAHAAPANKDEGTRTPRLTIRKKKG